MVGAQKFVAFIDPGSDRSLVRSSIAHQFGAIEPCKVVHLKGFGGNIYAVTKCVRATVVVDKVVSETVMYVVDDELLPEEVLLGKDVLCRPDVRLIIESGICQLENISVNTIMTETENHNFKMLLNEFKDCFASNLSGLGLATNAELSITVTSDVPITSRPYKIPYAKRATVNAIVDELLDLNIIRHSTSAYASPIVLAKKQNGEDRLCVDYRQLNAITVNRPYPMPIVEDQMAVLAGNKTFTSLDLVAGYHQIPVAESSKQYTAFVTNEGHYEYNRMPFGLVNAPGVFQTVINKIIQQLDRGVAVPYLDDIIIPIIDVSQGITLLRQFLTVLRTTGLTLRLSKCKFLAEEVTFLGHRINQHGISPGDIKTEAIRLFPQPKNLHELRQFLGLTGFFRKFVKNYADITHPLRPLLKTKDNPPFIWTSEPRY